MMTLNMQAPSNDSLASPVALKKRYNIRPGSFHWEPLSHRRALERQDASTCVIEDDEHQTAILMVGGTSPASLGLSTVELYDLNRRDWSLMPSMSSSRSGCCSASLGNHVYVFGGVNEKNERLDTCESFNRDCKEWSAEPAMPSHRWFGAAVGLPLHGNILVLGGRDCQWRELSSVQSFSTISKQWTDLSPMSSPRFGCGATRIASSSIMVVGGFDGKCWSTSAEVYNYEHNEWSGVAPMPERLEFCKATMLGKHHVLVSGKPPEGQRFKFYCYNIDQKNWSSFKAGHKFRDTVNVVAYGSQVLAIEDHSSNTFLSTNFLSIVEDDLTDSSSHSSDSHQVEQLLRSPLPPMSPSSFAGDGNMPWWAAAGMASARLKLEASQGLCSLLEGPGDGEEADMMSLLQDSTYRSEDDSVSPSFFSCYSPESTRSRRSSKLGKVKDLATSDSRGRQVIYSGYVSVAHKRPHGKGKMTWVESGDIYTGSFRHGRMDGFGRIRYANGDSFEGMFSKDLRNGPGVFRVKKNGRTVDCNYKNDLPDDPNGSMTWEDGTIYVGSFVEGKRTGKGMQRFPNGVLYQGDFVAGRYEGIGVCDFLDGSRYEGHWVKGKAHGDGKLINALGEIMHDGKWENDAPVYED